MLNFYPFFSFLFISFECMCESKKRSISNAIYKVNVYAHSHSTPLINGDPSRAVNSIMTWLPIYYIYIIIFVIIYLKRFKIFFFLYFNQLLDYFGFNKCIIIQKAFIFDEFWEKKIERKKRGSLITIDTVHAYVHTQYTYTNLQTYILSLNR